MLNVFDNFLYSNRFDQTSNSTPLINDAVKSRIIPAEFCDGDSRILDSRCIHSLNELNQKINTFMDGIIGNENKKLRIFHSNEKSVDDKNFNGFKSDFKKIGEITSKGGSNSVFDTFHVYLNGVELGNYYNYQTVIQKPLTIMEFESGDGNGEHGELKKTVAFIKAKFPADNKLTNKRVSSNPCNTRAILIGAIAVISGLVILKSLV